MNGPGDRAIAKYLARQASPEAALAERWGGRYRAVIVVPAFREAPDLLQGYRLAALGAAGRVLVIVVVNAARAHAPSSAAGHRRLLEALGGSQTWRLSSAPPAWLGRHEAFDVLAIDRATPEFCFPDGQGVGLARRIGCDVALALYARGQVELPYLFCTDADARLPADYFAALPGEPAAGLVFGFWHVPGGDAALDAATAVYELGLRYYVAGLAHARSPYAFHAIGSALAVAPGAYAAVRGFPKRLSGEDFYLLDKVAKVGAVCRCDAAIVSLASRASSRTAHGTGVAAVRIAAELEQGTTRFYHPDVFDLLGLWLWALDTLATERAVAPVRAALLRRAGQQGPMLDDALAELGAWDALGPACHAARAHAVLRARLHTWFDGFRTLKLIHALRRRGLHSLPFRQALAARWLPSADDAALAPVDALRRRFAEHLGREPRCSGVGERAAAP